VEAIAARDEERQHVPEQEAPPMDHGHHRTTAAITAAQNATPTTITLRHPSAPRVPSVMAPDQTRRRRDATGDAYVARIANT
jgi:hypothetical protein